MGFTPRQAGETPSATGDVARYIAEMTAELKDLAAGAGLGLVAYLLAMASEDAAATAAGLEAAQLESGDSEAADLEGAELLPPEPPA